MMKRKKFCSAVVSASLAFLAIGLIHLIIWLESPAALKDELQNWPSQVIGWAIVSLVIGVGTHVAIDSKLRPPKGNKNDPMSKADDR